MIINLKMRLELDDQKNHIIFPATNGGDLEKDVASTVAHRWRLFEDLLAALGELYQTIELSNITHDVVCNGVHADNGLCEGDVLFNNTMEKARSALAKARKAGA